MLRFLNFAEDRAGNLNFTLRRFVNLLEIENLFRICMILEGIIKYYFNTSNSAKQEALIARSADKLMKEPRGVLEGLSTDKHNHNVI